MGEITAAAGAMAAGLRADPPHMVLHWMQKSAHSVSGAPGTVARANQQRAARMRMQGTRFGARCPRRLGLRWDLLVEHGIQGPFRLATAGFGAGPVVQLGRIQLDGTSSPGGRSCPARLQSRVQDRLRAVGFIGDLRTGKGAHRRHALATAGDAYRFRKHPGEGCRSTAGQPGGIWRVAFTLIGGVENSGLRHWDHHRGVPTGQAASRATAKAARNRRGGRPGLPRACLLRRRASASARSAADIRQGSRSRRGKHRGSVPYGGLPDLANPSGSRAAPQTPATKAAGIPGFFHRTTFKMAPRRPDLSNWPCLPNCLRDQGGW